MYKSLLQGGQQLKSAQLAHQEKFNSRRASAFNNRVGRKELARTGNFAVQKLSMASSSNDLAVRHRGTGIAIVTTVGCPYCKKAKDALGRHNLHFDEIELTRDLELLRRIKETTKQSTVPQVRLMSALLGLQAYHHMLAPTLWPP